MTIKRIDSLIFILLFLLIHYAWIYTFKGNEYMLLWGANVFPFIAACITISWLLQTFRITSGKQRYFWLILSIGILNFIIAQIIWFYYQIILKAAVPYPSWADFFWLVEYLFFLVALVYQTKLISKGSSIVRFAFDIIVFMTLATALSIHFLIKPFVFLEENPFWMNVVSLAYPLIDLAILFITIRFYYFSQFSDKKYKKVLSVISIGYFAQIIGDSYYIYIFSIGKYTPGNFFEPLWLLPLFLKGYAALCSQQTADEPESKFVLNERKYKLIPYVSIVILLVVFAFENTRQFDFLYFGSIVIAFALIKRQLFILVENEKLLQKSQHLTGELIKKNNELAKSEERYRQLVEVSPNAITVSKDGKFVYANKAVQDLLGASTPEEVIGKSIYELIPHEYHETIKLRTKAIKENKILNALEYPVICFNGKIVYIESSLIEVDFNGEKALMSVANDITERKKNEEKVNLLAYYDGLTGLPNRVMLYESLFEELQRAKINHSVVAIMFIDLDRFKVINDTMGHHFGDLLLKEVSKRLVQLIGDCATVFRHGGDEFIVVLTGTNVEKTSELAQRIIDGFKSLFILDGHDFFTSPSIGISCYPKDADNVEDLIKYADIAMYIAKKQGKNNFKFYTIDSDKKSLESFRLESSLRKALQNNELFLLYQPKVRLETGTIIGFEALIRWRHPEFGLIGPDKFIPIAEEIGIIDSMGDWILQEACKQAKAWHESGYADLTIAVNISPLQLKNKKFIHTVRRVLEETKLKAKYLELEITENIMQDIEESASILCELDKVGVKISIDDFGKGYSSFSYLKQLPIHNIKIDKSFIDDVAVNSCDEAIVKAIIDMGNHLNFNVIAEGIENEQQVLFLKQNHCNIGQGYFFSKPRFPHEIVDLNIMRDIYFLNEVNVSIS